MCTNVLISRKKILFIEPNLNPPGGGNAVVGWMLEALMHDYDVTLLTWVPVDLHKVNCYYGTSLRETDVTIHVAPAVIRYLIDHYPNDFWRYLPFCGLMRWCKLINHRFDMVMSANNETDFGIRGIQYVHYGYHHVTWAREVYLGQQNRWYSSLIKFIETRLRAWRLISGFSFQRMTGNVTLVNSHWTGGHFQRAYHAKGHVIYPPVQGGFPEVPWRDRENGFVCISRISREKNLEEMVDILAEVRLDFPDVHLHIIGPKVADDDAYYQRVKRKAARHASWVFLEEDISRGELVTLVSRQRYGIHGMKDEHFGIAVAEMVKAGCVTFVPNGGGQVEIVGKEPRLLYRTKEEAVNKILKVMHSRQEQQELRRYLDSRKDMFSNEKFVQQIRVTVSEFFESGFFEKSNSDLSKP